MEIKRLKIDEKFLYDRSFRGENVAIIYPNSYFIGSSNLGFQSTIKILQKKGFTVNRYFIEKDGKIVSPDSKLPLKKYNKLFFSISFEPDLLNLLKILKLSEIEFFNEKREQIIFCGGPAVTINPFIYAFFSNYIYIGDNELLLDIDSIEKGFFHSEFLLKIATKKVFDKRGWIFKNIKRDFSDIPVFSAYISNFTSFANYLLIEVTRGCTFKCKFCNYGIIAHPYRIKSLEKILTIIEKNKKFTKNIGLISAILPDFKFLKNIIEPFKNELYFHISSLRVDQINDDFFEVLQYLNLKTLTFAIEAVDDGVRREIGKNFKNYDILHLVYKSIPLNIFRFKFYLIYGLYENEVNDTIDFFSFLTGKIKEKFHIQPFISLSINPLIPKPMSSFGNKKLIEHKDYKDKIIKLKQGLKKYKNIEISFLNYKDARLQYLISNFSFDLKEKLYEYYNTFNKNIFFKNLNYL